MPVIPAGFGYATVEMTCAGTSDPIINTWGFENVLGDPAADCAFNFFAAYDNEWCDVLSDAITVIRASVLMGDGSAADQFGSAAGRNVSQPCPPNTAVLVKKVTGISGRANRGRCYLPGVDEAQVASNGVISAGELADWQSSADDFMSALTAAGQELAILHSAGISPPTAVLALRVENKVATQRRRLR